MRHTMMLLSSLGFVLSACVGDPDLGQHEHELKAGKHKMFATRRAPDNAVSVFKRNGAPLPDMTGTGLTVPFGPHVDGNNVYIVSQGTSSIYAHLHTKGEKKAGTQYTLTELVPSGSGGLTTPFYVTTRGDVLYASSHATDQILAYHKTTGAFLGVTVAAGEGGLDGPRGLAWKDGVLYVSSSITHKVLAFDASGAFSHELVSSGIPVPCGLAINGDGMLCVGSAGNLGVHCFELDGTPVYSHNTGRVCGIDFGPGGDLYTARPDIGTVERHDFSGSVETFATVNMIAGVAWGDDDHDDDDDDGDADGD